jgi:arsenate reductase
VEVLQLAEKQGMDDKQKSHPRVLFLCTHNSARSQMAEGLMRDLSDGVVEAHSAGTEATKVRPEAILAMRELGIDISNQWSKTMDEFIQQRFHYVVTVCDSANESCPIFPNAEHRVHWSIDDPSGVDGDEETRLAAFREVRDDLRERIERELIPAMSKER